MRHKQQMQFFTVTQMYILMTAIRGPRLHGAHSMAVHCPPPACNAERAELRQFYNNSYLFCRLFFPVHIVEGGLASLYLTLNKFSIPCQKKKLYIYIHTHIYITHIYILDIYISWSSCCDARVLTGSLECRATGSITPHPAQWVKDPP